MPVHEKDMDVRVKGVTFEGVSFTGQRPTYMEPHVSITMHRR